MLLQRVNRVNGWSTSKEIDTQTRRRSRSPYPASSASDGRFEPSCSVEALERTGSMSSKCVFCDFSRSGRSSIPKDPVIFSRSGAICVICEIFDLFLTYGRFRCCERINLPRCPGARSGTSGVQSDHVSMLLIMTFSVKSSSVRVSVLSANSSYEHVE